MTIPPNEHNDELLSSFLEVPEEEDEVHLEALLHQVQPVLYAGLHRKSLSHASQADLKDELLSAMMVRIIEQLRRCKQSHREGNDTVFIRHFPALCKIIADTTISEYLRLKYPRRASVRNRLQYAINETRGGNKQLLFALWRDVEEHICGFWSWKGRDLVPTSSHQLLETNPLFAMQQAIPVEYTKKQPVVQVLDSMLHWLGSPAAFDSVVQATVCWYGIEEYSEVSLFQSPSEDGFVAFDPVAPDLSPEQRLLLNEHLRQLWHDVAQLPPKHCAALLLNLRDAQGRGMLGFLPALGIATFSQIASAMNMDMQQFKTLWPRLPLDDGQIGELYGCGPGSVSVWRSRARLRLLKNAENASS